jgi:hypothetical protein
VILIKKLLLLLVALLCVGSVFGVDSYQLFASNITYYEVVSYDLNLTVCENKTDVRLKGDGLTDINFTFHNASRQKIAWVTYGFSTYILSCNDDGLEHNNTNQIIMWGIVMVRLMVRMELLGFRMLLILRLLLAKRV